MSKKSKKITLSAFTQTQVTEINDPEAIPVSISNNTLYYVSPISSSDFTYTPEKGFHEKIRYFEYNLFPIVIDYTGALWAEANIYILNKIKNSLDPVMSTYSCIASDLVVYKTFLDEIKIDWAIFDKNKLLRPTYRYRAHLKTLIENGEIQTSTARRRMSSIIAFYQWLKKEKIIEPDYPMWNESDHYINLKSNYGATYFKKITSTDLSIKLPHTNNPYEHKIEDGGSLRPLHKEEQEWLLEALLTLGNYEMFLIHLLALSTGARIQSILTLRIEHVFLDKSSTSLHDMRIPAGPNTNIDTKYNKKIILHIPNFVYQKLSIYAGSPRAKSRRAKSPIGNSGSQYLFLSNRGTPYYSSKSDLQKFNRDFCLHHAKHGQTVRQYIKERVIPYIREKYNQPNFKYRFHDLRATFGMNLTEVKLNEVSQGMITLHDAREFVRSRMNHESSATTDLYLQYHHKIDHLSNISDSYNDHLYALIDKYKVSSEL